MGHGPFLGVGHVIVRAVPFLDDVSWTLVVGDFCAGE
jgi:hypothetical protein